MIGLSRAKEISFSARKVFADEAARLGFVTRVVPAEKLIDEAGAVARSITQWRPDHIRRIKSLMDRGFAMTLARALEFEAAQARAERRRYGHPARRARPLRWATHRSRASDDEIS